MPNSDFQNIMGVVEALSGGAESYYDTKEKRRVRTRAEGREDTRDEQLRNELDFQAQDRERMREKQELEDQMQILGPYLEAAEGIQGGNAAAQTNFQGDIGALAKTMVGRVGVGAASAGKGAATQAPAAPAGTIFRPDWQKIIEKADDVQEAEAQIDKMEAIYKKKGLAYIDPFGTLQNDPNKPEVIGPPVGGQTTVAPGGLERNFLPQDPAAEALTAMGDQGFAPLTMEDVFRDLPRFAEMLKPPKGRKKKIRPLTKGEVAKLSKAETGAITDLVNQIRSGGLDPNQDVNWKAMQKAMGGKFRVHLVRRAVISQLRQTK